MSKEHPMRYATPVRTNSGRACTNMGIAKKTCGSYRIPKPQMDWASLRLLKHYCENSCVYFDHRITTCGIGYFPGNCLVLKRKYTKVLICVLNKIRASRVSAYGA